MDGRTDGRYQVHYLPRFVVDKKYIFKKYSMRWSGPTLKRFDYLTRLYPARRQIL